jgi:hypothetical protein
MALLMSDIPSSARQRILNLLWRDSGCGSTHQGGDFAAMV